MLSTVALIIALHMQTSARVYARFTLPLNLITLVLVAIPCVTVVYNYASTSPFVPTLAESRTATTLEAPGAKASESPTLPDIYYIIPDGYPSDAWLQNAMNYDNSAFTQALKDSGFEVASHAQSNYGATLLSLASILNMRFYDENPSPFGDLDYLRLAIADSLAARQLQQLGYTYVQMLSGYLIPSPIADINRDFSVQGPIDIFVDRNDLSRAILKSPVGRAQPLGHFYKQSFLSLYLDTTMLGSLELDLEIVLRKDDLVMYGLFAPERFLATIDEIESVVSMPEATFTIIHLMKPHGPTVFDETGATIQATWKPNHQEYFAEFSFVNSKFLQLIHTILDRSDSAPVIIFQGDHGSTYGNVWTSGKRTTHFDTYAAYYFPAQFSVDIPQPFTLINSFPMILNALFGTEYEFQDDRLIKLLRGYSAPFEQQDVNAEFSH